MAMTATESRRTPTRTVLARRAVQARSQQAQIQITECACVSRSTDAGPILARSLVQAYHLETFVAFAVISCERRRTITFGFIALYVACSSVEARRLVCIAHVMSTIHTSKTRATDARSILAAPLVQARHVEAFVSVAHVSRERRRTETPRLTATDVTYAAVLAVRMVAVAHVVGATGAHVL